MLILACSKAGVNVGNLRKRSILKVSHVLRDRHDAGLMFGDKSREEAQFGIRVGVGDIDLPGNAFLLEQVENRQNAGDRICGFVSVAGGGRGYQVHSIGRGFDWSVRKQSVRGSELSRQEVMGYQVLVGV